MTKLSKFIPTDLSGWIRCSRIRLAIRHATEADRAFLFELHAVTHVDDLNWLDWTERQKQAFIDLQLRAKTAELTRKYPGSSQFVIERHSHAIGGLLLHGSATDLEVVELAFLPDRRGHGFGTAILHDLIEHCNAEARSVTLQTDAARPKSALSRRLGFVSIEGTENRMRRAPSALPSEAL